MKRARVLAVALTGIAVAVLGASSLAAAEKANIKELMGENFAGLQTILVALITSNYQTVPHQVQLIADHATQLTKEVPKRIKGQHDRDQFLTYAYNLRGHAEDLKSIAELLVEHDKSRGASKEIGTDQLREAAAAHYGGMVTMCVACHNRFRPQMNP